jgi:twitching motility protein PilT
LYSLLRSCGSSFRNIITIEDPVEVQIEGTTQLPVDDANGKSFAALLRSVLRQDPDVIMVGEMRDLPTIEAAITAAETGHIVFGTLHTSSAAGTINRIIDVFPTNQQEQIRTQLASAVIGILCQQLLRKIGGGRIAAFETLVVTPGIANLIRENKIFRIGSSIQTGSKHGMMLLDDYIFNLWRDGKIEKEDGLGKCNNAEELAKRFAQAERGVFDDQPTQEGAGDAA